MSNTRNPRLKSLQWLAIAVLLAAATGQARAAQLGLPANPLIVSNDVSPNIMFMVDNSGSMTNIVPDLPFDPTVTYLVPPAPAIACPAANVVPVGTSVDLNVRNVAAGTPRIVYGGRAYTFGTGTNQRCFNPTALYGARLFANGGTGDVFDVAANADRNFLRPGSYLDADYRGNYLNWYFNGTNTAVTWNAQQQRKPLTASPATFVQSRMEVARQAGVDLVSGLDARLRVGLSTYNDGNAGRLLEPIGSLDPLTTKRADIISDIQTLTPSGNTPLAETVSDIGRYFTQGNTTNSLTLRPGGPGAPSTATVVDVFNNHSFLSNNTTPPITLSCQQSFAAILTDGRPQGDRAIGTPLRDYKRDCAAGLCNAAINDGSNTAVTITAANRGTLQNGVQVGRDYESGGSDHIDDVLKALFDMDLRPDFPVESDGPQFKNNIVSYMIGFADEQVLNDPLLRAAGEAGGAGDIDGDGPGDGDGDGIGDGFLVASNAAELATVFGSIISNVLERSASFSSAALNSTSLNAGSRLFQAGFDGGLWTGTLKAFSISLGDTTGPCTSEDLGRVCDTPDWEAGALLDAANPDLRRILTFNNATKAGIPFRWASLPLAQQNLLNRNPAVVPTVTADTLGDERLAFLRGDRSLEDSAFRLRGSRLGDIVDSDPFYVAAPNSAFPFSGYSAFRAANSSRMPVVYVGSNDGMLHGFRADTGAEVLAYVPGMLYGTDANPKLARLTAKPYTHLFGVDGSALVGDIQIGSGAWKSYLVGTMRYGAQGLFALDVTNPSTFSESQAANIVKWEFTSADDADLGYTFSQPRIVKMKNDRWAAIIGNGYNNREPDGSASSDGRAALFVIFMDGPSGTGGTWVEGTDYLKFKVGPNPTALELDNGMATAAPTDIDGDRLVDYIYAGDLKGNMWQFNVNCDPRVSGCVWKVGYGTGGNPLFTALDNNGLPQPITAAPEVGPNLNTADPDDLTVYVGTGRYIATGDNTRDNQQNQTFYGIFADPVASDGPPPETPTSPYPAKSELLRQKVLREVTTSVGPARLTSQELLLDTHKGWYIDLYNTQTAGTDPSPASGLNKGERQISQPALRGGRIVFTTLIPAATPCDFGGEGWFMELDARTGGRPRRPALDITNDLIVDETDLFDSDGDGTLDSTVSGIGSSNGMMSGAAFMAVIPGRETRYVTLSDGSVVEIGGAASGRTGRLTWREISP